MGDTVQGSLLKKLGEKMLGASAGYAAHQAPPRCQPSAIMQLAQTFSELLGPIKPIMLLSAHTKSHPDHHFGSRLLSVLFKSPDNCLFRWHSQNIDRLISTPNNFYLRAGGPLWDLQSGNNRRCLHGCCRCCQASSITCHDHPWLIQLKESNESWSF